MLQIVCKFKSQLLTVKELSPGKFPSLLAFHFCRQKKNKEGVKFKALCKAFFSIISIHVTGPPKVFDAFAYV